MCVWGGGEVCVCARLCVRVCVYTKANQPTCLATNVLPVSALPLHLGHQCTARQALALFVPPGLLLM